MEDRRFRWGLIATGIYGVGVTAYVAFNRVAVLDLQPNEMGDFLAGAASPLAFLWLVLGYLQQGDELKQNTAALKQQADELRQSVVQQAQLVAVSREQIEDERVRYRAETFPSFTSEVALVHRTSGALPAFVLKNIGAACSGVEATIFWENTPYLQIQDALPHMGQMVVDISTKEINPLTETVRLEFQFVTRAHGRFMTSFVLRLTRTSLEPAQVEVIDGPTEFIAVGR